MQPWTPPKKSIVTLLTVWLSQNGSKQARVVLVRVKFVHFLTQKSIVQPCSICSVTPPQISIKMRLATFCLHPTKVKHNLLLEETPWSVPSTSILAHVTNTFTFILQQPNLQSQKYGVFYCWGPRPPFQSGSSFEIISTIASSEFK